MAAQEWLQLNLLVDTAQAESLGGLLFGLGALGVEEHPVHDKSADGADGPTWAHATQLLPRTPTKHTELRAYLPLDLPTSQQAEITELALQFGVARETIVWSKLRDDGWSTRWQAFFKPLPIGDTLLICPSWEDLPPNNTRHVIWLDPGMAFGTGHHATTRSCLLLLEKLLQKHKTPPPILDVGCGSGILTMAAVHLGAPSAYGVDIDADAIMVAKENAEINKLQAQVSFDTTPIEEVSGEYQLIVANIQAHILTPMAPHLKARLAQGGTLLLSGIWYEFASALIVTFQEIGLEVTERIEDDQWITLCLQ